MGKHYTAREREQIERLRQSGETYASIGKQLGRRKEHIKEYFRRKRNNEQLGIYASPPGRKGRPRTTPLTKMREFELRVNELERENDLLRSFLRAAGRR